MLNSCHCRILDIDVKTDWLLQAGHWCFLKVVGGMLEEGGGKSRRRGGRRKAPCWLAQREIKPDIWKWTAIYVHPVFSQHRKRYDGLEPSLRIWRCCVCIHYRMITAASLFGSYFFFCFLFRLSLSFSLQPHVSFSFHSHFVFFVSHSSSLSLPVCLFLPSTLSILTHTSLLSSPIFLSSQLLRMGCIVLIFGIGENAS